MRNPAETETREKFSLEWAVRRERTIAAPVYYDDPQFATDAANTGPVIPKI